MNPYPRLEMPRHPVERPDPRLVRWLVRWLVFGVVAMVLVPAARGSLPWIGWAPLWLLGMPLSAWWALHRFPLPRWPRRPAGMAPRRRPGMQARRRTRRRGAGLARAA